MASEYAEMSEQEADVFRGIEVLTEESLMLLPPTANGEDNQQPDVVSWRLPPSSATDTILPA